MRVQALLPGLCLVLLLFMESDSLVPSISPGVPGHPVKGQGVIDQRDLGHTPRGPPLTLTPIFLISPSKGPLWGKRQRTACAFEWTPPRVLRESPETQETGSTGGVFSSALQ